MKPFILITIFFLPYIATAQRTYESLVKIPGVATNDFDAYINSIYAVSISIAALLAVIKIIVAGVKWMTTDVVTSKSDAKNDIRGALIGLVVVMSAVLILTVINPQITNVDIRSFGTPAPPFVGGGSGVTLRDTALAAVRPGDLIVDIPRKSAPGYTSESERRTACEGVNTAQCVGGVRLDCYHGEFTPSPDGDTCIVRAANTVSVDAVFDCTDTNPNSATNVSKAGGDCAFQPGGFCTPSVWDCSTAEQRCVAAGHNFVQESGSGGRQIVRCQE